MRQYPRRVYKSLTDNKLVTNEIEEKQASSQGYESHWNPEINAKRKGTDREVLREEPIKEIQKVVREEKTEKPAENREQLSPQKRAAITRKKNKASKEV